MYYLPLYNKFIKQRIWQPAWFLFMLYLFIQRINSLAFNLTDCFKFSDKDVACKDFVQYCEEEGGLGDIVRSTCQTSCNICAETKDQGFQVRNNETIEFKLGVISPCGEYPPELGIQYWLDVVGKHIPAGEGYVKVNYTRVEVCPSPDLSTEEICEKFKHAAAKLVSDFAVHAALVAPECGHGVSAVYEHMGVLQLIWPTTQPLAIPWTFLRWWPFSTLDQLNPVLQLFENAGLMRVGVLSATDSGLTSQSLLADKALHLVDGSLIHSSLELVFLQGYNSSMVNGSSSSSSSSSSELDGGSDWDAVLREMERREVEAAMFFSGRERVDIMERIHHLGIDFKAIYFYQEDGTLWAELGEAANLVLTETLWLPQATYPCSVFGSNSEFVSGFSERHGGRAPTQQEAMGATAGVILTLAMQSAGSIGPVALGTSLSTLTANTIMGAMDFHHSVNHNRQLLIVQYLAGGVEIVAPDSLATSEPYLPVPSWICRNLSRTIEIVECTDDLKKQIQPCLDQYPQLKVTVDSSLCPEDGDDDDRDNHYAVPHISDRAKRVLLLVGVGLAALVVLSFVVYRRMSARSFTWLDARNLQQVVDGQGNPLMLGQGAFGDIYAANFYGTKVAVKRVLPPLENLATWLIGSMSRSAKSYKRAVVSDLNKVRPVEGNHFDPQNPEEGGSALLTTTEEDEGDLNRVSEFQDLTASGTSNRRRSRKSSLRERVTQGSVVISSLFKEQFMNTTTAQFTEDMKIVMKIRHPHLVSVLGAFKTEELGCCMVMEHMEYGSVADALKAKLAELEEQTLVRVLFHTVSGLLHLHQGTSSSSPHVHGDIRARHILLDSNFNAKLADYGMKVKATVCGVHDNFWTAPELIKDRSVPEETDTEDTGNQARWDSRTPASDIFSFGITIWEVFSGGEKPYANLEGKMQRSEVLEAIRVRDLRPRPPQNMHSAMKDLMTECWHKNPDRRPSTQEVHQRLGNILDEYRAEAEAAKLLQVKNADLLYQVFPKHVADVLRLGGKVVPETFDPVTLFFSDIVGYTDLSSTLPPSKVMNMLDRMYTQFDVTCKSYQLFKVETIGDAYMCVSGLPKQQFDHTLRVALFSMDVVKAANSTPIDLEDPIAGNINIRVGFHCGEVVGSVVGELNPRYCLFGDTVNTASRMESNSEKNCINMSPQATRNLKNQAPNVQVIDRGPIQIKGKGLIECAFLCQSDDNYAHLQHYLKTRKAVDVHIQIPEASTLLQEIASPSEAPSAASKLKKIVEFNGSGVLNGFLKPLRLSGKLASQISAIKSIKSSLSIASGDGQPRLPRLSKENGSHAGGINSQFSHQSHQTLSSTNLSELNEG